MAGKWALSPTVTAPLATSSPTTQPPLPNTEQVVDEKTKEEGGVKTEDNKKDEVLQNDQEQEDTADESSSEDESEGSDSGYSTDDDEESSDSRDDEKQSDEREPESLVPVSPMASPSIQKLRGPATAKVDTLLPDESISLLGRFSFFAVLNLVKHL